MLKAEPDWAKEKCCLTLKKVWAVLPQMFFQLGLTVPDKGTEPSVAHRGSWT